VAKRRRRADGARRPFGLRRLSRMPRSKSEDELARELRAELLFQP
jgi:hypothetical protein